MKNMKVLSQTDEPEEKKKQAGESESDEEEDVMIQVAGKMVCCYMMLLQSLKNFTIFAKIHNELLLMRIGL